MAGYSQQTEAIRKFILDSLETHPQDIAIVTARKFGVSRQAVLRHLSYLLKNRLISAKGTTRDRTYGLRNTLEVTKNYALPGLEEDKVWNQDFRILLTDLPPNVLAIFDYGFTEMVNNAIEHSEGSRIEIRLQRTAINAEIWVMDNGIGIFNKIQRELALEDPVYSILELAKGKLTTDPQHHTGEGIFFTSRMFDRYFIWSGNLYFSHLGDRDWLLEDKDEDMKGTFVGMKIRSDSGRTTQEVFDHYSAGDDYGFSKTLVPVFLAQYGSENLVSRSQAKRLLSRVDRFKEIVLDFNKVETIGQAFADEIFRVFQAEHPAIRLLAINTNEEVAKMIKRAEEASKSPE